MGLADAKPPRLTGRLRLLALMFALTGLLLWTQPHPTDDTTEDHYMVVRLRVTSRQGGGASSGSSDRNGGGGSAGGGRDSAAAAAADGIYTAPTSLRGLVTKAGPLDSQQWQSDSAVERSALFNEYLLQQEAEHPWGTPPSSALPQPPPITFPKCQVFVNHFARVLYLRHAKAGSSSVLRWFGFCNEQRRSGRDSCMDLLDPATPSEEVARLWSQYFVFTAVRNPFDRAVSQYKFLVKKMHARPECEEMVSWDRFCASPPSMGLACRRRPECCVMKEGFAYIHLNAQAACMTTADGGLAVDYVAAVERLDEEMPALFAAINARRPADRPPLPLPAAQAVRHFNADAKCQQGRQANSTWRGHITLAPREQYCSTAEYFGQRHPRCAAQVAAYWAADLRLLMVWAAADGSDGGGGSAGGGAGSSSGSSSSGGRGGSSSGSSGSGGRGGHEHGTGQAGARRLLLGRSVG